MDSRLKIHFLGSGSAGNATLIQYGSTAILMDCGFSARELTRRLLQVHVRPEDITAILLTHEHSDHTRGLAVFLKQHALPVFLTGRTAGAVRLGRQCQVERIIVTPGKTFCIDSVSVHPFTLAHDAREPVGYTFSFPNSTRLGMATDLGHPGPEVVAALAGCHWIGLESNHDPVMLREGPYPWHLKRRIQSHQGHLSNPAAADLLGHVASGNLRHLFALHLSETNNRPALVKRILGTRLAELGYAAPVTVVAQDRPWSFCEAGQLSLFG